jgi:hypothetical protein
VALSLLEVIRAVGVTHHQALWSPDFPPGHDSTSCCHEANARAIIHLAKFS